MQGIFVSTLLFQMKREWQEEILIWKEYIHWIASSSWEEMMFRKKILIGNKIQTVKKLILLVKNKQYEIVFYCLFRLFHCLDFDSLGSNGRGRSKSCLWLTFILDIKCGLYSLHFPVRRRIFFRVEFERGQSPFYSWNIFYLFIFFLNLSLNCVH